MKTAYFDLMCGASGDMILAALLDAGASLDALRDGLSRLGLSGLRVDIRPTRRSGMQCSQMVFAWDDARSYRHLPDILGMIGKAGYSAEVYERCEKILYRLAEAEAAVHGIDIEKVHFHEIGAVDTIVDVAGICLCLESLGIGRVMFSEITVGHGTVEIEHGRLPVPVPATTRMIQGLRMRSLDVSTEILTPTGCAVLTALGEQSPGLPPGAVTRTGYGCGTKVFDHQPNALRVLLMDTGAEHAGDADQDTVCVLESDMDHISGECMAHAAQACLDAGALDISWSPLFMKKGRPGYRLTVMCTPKDTNRLIDTVIAQTRTLGVRYRDTSRVVARREVRTREFMGHEVEEKTCTYRGRSFSKLEYESLAALARTTGRALPDIVDEYLREGGRTGQ